MGKKILVIGGVALGPKAASRARRLDPEAEITIIDRGDVFSYAGCGMPFYIEGMIDDIDELLCTNLGVPRDEKYFMDVKNIKLLGHTEALKVNRSEKIVTVQNLQTNRVYDIGYDKLVLGLGATPVVPPIEGMNLKGVYRLYGPNDAVAIRAEVDHGVKKVAVVGGGLIGMEVCGSFASRDCQVTVLEMMERLVPALLDPDMSMLLEKRLRQSGINLGLGQRVSRIIADDSGRAKAVETADGSVYDADLVIVAIGVRPNVKLARDAGLAIGVTGAISVNECLLTSDPDIYAGGDCVENTDILTGRRVYMPLGSTANKHGRVIGDNVVGGSTRFPGISGTAVFRVMGYNVGKTGLGEGEARALGFNPVVSVAPRTDSSDYYPEKKLIILKMIADCKGKLLGCQALGTGDLVKRVDVVASCIKFGADISDLADIDLGYAPPYSTAIDAIAHAANIIRNKLDGLAHGITAIELKAKMEGFDDFILLDVRSRGEVENHPFTDHRVVNIPLDELRPRIGELKRDTEIVTFCQTSVRAYEAERLLRGVGFRDVKFLDGSLMAWPY